MYINRLAEIVLWTPATSKKHKISYVLFSNPDFLPFLKSSLPPSLIPALPSHPCHAETSRRDLDGSEGKTEARTGGKNTEKNRGAYVRGGT
jgi:hypothetical protein